MYTAHHLDDFRIENIHGGRRQPVFVCHRHGTLRRVKSVRFEAGAVQTKRHASDAREKFESKLPGVDMRAFVTMQYFNDADAFIRERK